VLDLAFLTLSITVFALLLLLTAALERR